MKQKHRPGGAFGADDTAIFSTCAVDQLTDELVDDGPERITCGGEIVRCVDAPFLWLPRISMSGPLNSYTSSRKIAMFMALDQVRVDSLSSDDLAYRGRKRKHHHR